MRRVHRRTILQAAGAAIGAMAVGSIGGGHAFAQTTADRSIIRRAIPKTREEIPVVGLGTFETFDVLPGEPRAHIREIMRRFHEAGGRVVDTSPLYGMSEVSVGDFATELGIADDLFITNKTWTTGEWLSDESHSEAQFRRSMERLWRSRMDVQQVHSLENVDQVLHTLRRWKSEGRVRYIGVTQWSPEYYDTMERLIRSGDLDFVQVNYTIFSRQAEARILPACADNGVAVQVNIPFEKARLFTCVEGRPLPEFAAEFGAKSWAQFFLKFIISHPAVTNVIPATSNPDHLTDNVGALYGNLPDEAMRARMVRQMESIKGFANTLRQPPYPGKNYGGVVTWPFRRS
ncbi:aldo/keto reductase [Rhizobium sullae]|uniref:Diketogulonate reductase-like aldo/keto reductase n=1 Tax=Rhizobium sullae TaxID=50338 RepID=A0A4R3PVN2_RHISU|nr:aldo/keto reductase [Rhizobium sullae]TCU12620.1 diketogulonate reductase-like aldo/keto reductase [Rhizobium sullae]